MYVHILGRQPALGLAELESRFGAKNVRPISGGSIALVEHEDLAISSQLGGTIKIGKLLTPIPTTAWPKLLAYLEEHVPEHLQYIPEGKIKFGLSVYGIDERATRINAGALQIKKAIKNAGRSVRVVPNQEPILSSAQTLHNQLTGELGMELMLIKNGSETLLAQAVHVQNIESYSQRDRERPKRDAKVGMLPPKLAQIIINLAYSPSFQEKDTEDPFLLQQTLLDPFCGTGVVLQEALLMSFRAYGSDIDERMVRYSRDNINWLQDTMGAQYGWYLEEGDATNHTWRQPIDVVAGETYLGAPLTTLPAPAELDKIVRTCDIIHRKFLENISTQLTSGTRLCLAVPAWRVKNTFRHLPMLDDLKKLGYNRVDFKHVRASELIYHRETQLVARELVVLTRK